MTRGGWYTAVGPETPITQGDIVFDCPVMSWRSEPVEFTPGSSENEILKTAIAPFASDVVIMTQACDLEQDSVSSVILCPTMTLAQYKKLWDAELPSQGQNPTAKAWRRFCSDIRNGSKWNLSMLNLGEAGTLTTENRVVDFAEVFTVPKTFLTSLLIARNVERLRLLPPYREHLSQAFARFFMRVGLPTPVAEDW